MSFDSKAAAACRLITKTPEMSHSTARILCWLIGLSEKSGGFPLELSYSQMIRGLETQSGPVPGIGRQCRVQTIVDALDFLETHETIKVSQGSLLRGGTYAKVIDLRI